MLFRKQKRKQVQEPLRPLPITRSECITLLNSPDATPKMKAEAMEILREYRRRD